MSRQQPVQASHLNIMAPDSPLQIHCAHCRKTLRPQPRLIRWKIGWKAVVGLMILAALGIGVLSWHPWTPPRPLVPVDAPYPMI